MWLGREVESILEATLTVFPQISYCGFCAPITPATTGPRFRPARSMKLLYEFSFMSASLSFMSKITSTNWHMYSEADSSSSSLGLRGGGREGEERGRGKEKLMRQMKMNGPVDAYGRKTRREEGKSLLRMRRRRQRRKWGEEGVREGKKKRAFLSQQLIPIIDCSFSLFFSLFLLFPSLDSSFLFSSFLFFLSPCVLSSPFLY